MEALKEPLKGSLRGALKGGFLGGSLKHKVSWEPLQKEDGVDPENIRPAPH